MNDPEQAEVTLTGSMIEARKLNAMIEAKLRLDELEKLVGREILKIIMEIYR